MDDKSKVPILVYHHIYPEGSPELKAATGDSSGVIGEVEFRRHLEFISNEGWNVVSTSDVVDWIIDGTPLPDRAVALHFDNGWLDTRTVTMPIVKELGMTATCFPITDGVEARCSTSGFRRPLHRSDPSLPRQQSEVRPYLACEPVLLPAVDHRRS